VKHGYLSEEVAAVKADTWAQLLTVSRQNVINDDVGVFLQSAAALLRPQPTNPENALPR
jgi:hypothetical protein